MEHLAITLLESEAEREQLEQWLETTPDGELFDRDVLDHDSTFTLCARGSGSGRQAYLPVQQPLMLENLVFRPGLTERETAVAITRMVERAIGEAYRRDVGELYFLCRDASTCSFAERHKFKPLSEIDPKLKVYRLNLLETFGR
jgi:hypothetical protein